MLFLGIISWKGTSRFNRGEGGGEVVFQIGGASFLSGVGVGVPWGGHWF